MRNMEKVCHVTTSFQICDNVKNKGWKVVRDPASRMGPYAYKGNQWVGYDDVDTIRMKTEYIKKNNLGGAMIWALDLDDFKDRCECETHPLLRTINRVLGRISIPEPQPVCTMTGNYRQQEEKDTYIADLPAAPYYKCEQGLFQKHPSDCKMYRVCNHEDFTEVPCPAGLEWYEAGKRCDWPETAQCKPGAGSPADEADDFDVVVTDPQESPAPSPPAQRPIEVQKPDYPPQIDNEVSMPDTGMKVVCYFTNWAWYRKGTGKYVPEDIDPNLCTHVNYGFAVLDPNELKMKPHDTWADMDNKFYEKVCMMSYFSKDEPTTSYFILGRELEQGRKGQGPDRSWWME